MRFLLFFFYFLLQAFLIQAQVLNVNSAKTVLSTPFAGGLNAVQFGEIDLNLDGIKDLLVFDRHGNQLSCYLNGGTPNQMDYTFAPQFVENFPDLNSWVMLIDYNMDGKNDLFTFSYPAGIKVYKNISSASLQFELVVYPFLNSQQNGVNTNILVTPGDYPAIYDIDQDGDLDILTFSPFGAWVDMHKNLSQEEYGHSDSLHYEKTTSCWGHFAESDESNLLFLDTCLNQKPQFKDPYRHTGSTFLMIPNDESGLADLLLGDIDFSQPIYLHNNGSLEEANMDFFTNQYPNEENPIQLYSFPVSQFIDVNNDGHKDLLVSTFDSRFTVCQNSQNIYLYLSNGTDFQLETKSFLQDNMIDVGALSHPIIKDINQDNIPDLIVGNHGYFEKASYDNYGILHVDFRSKIMFYQGSIEEGKIQFSEKTKDLGNLSNLNVVDLYPTFGDLDNDGDMDLLCGMEDGSLSYHECIGIENGIPQYASTELNYANIDIGENSTPILFDLNQDNLLDLIIGGKNGKLSYYKNTGSLSSPYFVLITNFLGQIDVTDPNLSAYGYSTPNLYLDNNNHIHLLIGSEQGELFYYKNIENYLLGSYPLSEDLADLLGISDFQNDSYLQTSPYLTNLNADQYAELFIGNMNGGITFTSSMNTPEVDFITETPISLSIFPNPCTDYVNFIGIDFHQINSVKISNSLGKVLLQIKPNSNKINLQALNNGIYFIEFLLKDGIFSTKIIVQK